MKKIAVIGSRNFSDYNHLTYVLDTLIETLKEEVIIVSGGAKGADSLAEKYALEKNIEIVIFQADWKNFDQPCYLKEGRYGKYNSLAGFNRNKKIVNESDFIIAFWDGQSRGTLDSIEYAKSLNKKISIINIK